MVAGRHQQGKAGGWLGRAADPELTIPASRPLGVASGRTRRAAALLPRAARRLVPAETARAAAARRAYTRPMRRLHVPVTRQHSPALPLPDAGLGEVRLW
jgi:hypothetical protein